MKKIFFVLLIFFLNGCATPGIGTESFRKELVAKKDFPKDTALDFIAGKIKLGMTKEQIFWICGSPMNWSKYPGEESMFETWSYSIPQGSISERILTLDFKDGILIGYGGNGKYFSDKYAEDLRNFTK